MAYANSMTALGLRPNYTIAYSRHFQNSSIYQTLATKLGKIRDLNNVLTEREHVLVRPWTMGASSVPTVWVPYCLRVPPSCHAPPDDPCR